MGNSKLKIIMLTAFIYLSSFLIVFANGQRLEILPVQSIQRKPVGKSLMLTCRPDVPDANLVTDLQWKDNQNMTVLPKPSGQVQPKMYTETLPGDQSLALLISSLTEAMGGYYYCTASYANSLMLNTSVLIETYVAITWKDAPENQFPTLGSDYIVKCEVTASPAPTVDWYRNGDPVKNGGRYAIETRGLLIRNVKETDDGIYTCRAAVVETGELADRNIRVEVYIKPIVSQLPTQLEAVEGQSFSTYCNATGKPVPAFEWIKDQTLKNVATVDRFLVNPQTGLLTITKVEQEDYGTYICQATNDAGISVSRTKLNVLVKPKIFELYNTTAVLIKEGAITCRATGRPAPEITFRRWGSDEEFIVGPQRDDDRIILEQYANQDEGSSTGTLRISKLIRSDDGLYQCIARNKGAEAFKTGHITVESKPNFDHMKNLPPVYSWEERVANLSCLAMGIPNATIEWRWEGRLMNDVIDQNIVVNGKGPRSDLIITPRSRMYYSVYKCIARNIHGEAEIDMELREARVPGDIVSAIPRIVTATTITFDIIGPSTDRGLPIKAYSVQYKEDNQRDWLLAQNRTWSPDSPYIVEGLRPQTGYSFHFAARNQVGMGPWSVPRPQSTPRRSAPEEPKTLHSPVVEDDDDPVVVSPYSDHFNLRWSVPADNGEPIDYYQVLYCPGLKMNGKWTELENECRKQEIVEATNFDMASLNGNTYYRIELKAHNAIGFSLPSSIIMKTARDNPYNSGTTCPINAWLIITLLLATFISTILSTTTTTTPPPPSSTISTTNNGLSTSSFQIVNATTAMLNVTQSTSTLLSKKESSIITSMPSKPSSTNSSDNFNSNLNFKTNSIEFFGGKKRKLRTELNCCGNYLEISKINFVQNLQQH